ncbi:MAG: hypothetical protein IPP32_00125 [Bacteroidetes bacterium]|nr:hypothetical protein [Bacteroidota bacterium]
MSENTYIPGVCNIGPAEINRRKSKLKLALVLLLFSTLLFFILPFPVVTFSIVACIATYTFILIFQLRQKFCIVFGWKSIYNFNAVKSRKTKVDDETWRALDRKQTLKIVLYSFLSTGLFLALIFLLKKTI